jgi:hypothetical protein
MRGGLGVSLLMMGTAAWLAWPLTIAITRDRRGARARRTVQRRRRAGARVLVVGDGVMSGAADGPRRETIAARLATAHPDWTVGNLARPGSRTSDVARVLGRLARRLDRTGQGAVYDAVIVHTGGSDALRFTRQGPLSVALVEALACSASVARHTLLVTGDNIALASSWPWSWLLGWRGERVRSLFEAIAWEAGVGYVHASSDDGGDVVDAVLGSRLGPRRKGMSLHGAGLHPA